MLADDDRVETGRNREEMPDRGSTAEGVRMVGQIDAVASRTVSQSTSELTQPRSRQGGLDIDLPAVAGRQEHHTAHLWSLEQARHDPLGVDASAASRPRTSTGQVRWLTPTTASSMASCAPGGGRHPVGPCAAERPRGTRPGSFRFASTSPAGYAETLFDEYTAPPSSFVCASATQRTITQILSQFLRSAGCRITDPTNGGRRRRRGPIAWRDLGEVTSAS